MSSGMTAVQMRELAGKLATIMPAVVAEFMERNPVKRSLSSLAELPTNPVFMMEASGLIEGELKRLLPAVGVTVGEPQRRASDGERSR